MTVSIKDVAQAARVSVASVSRVINGHKNVDAQTREHILAVMRELRYIPHTGARSLSTKRTGTLGVLLPDLHGEFFSELIRGIDQAVRARGLHILVASLHGGATELASSMRAMRGRVDGLLVMSPHVDADLLRENLPEGLPVSLMNSAATRLDACTVSVDNDGGARTMTRHLYAAGYRKIAFLSGPAGNIEANQRLLGFCAAFAELLPQTAPVVFPGDFSEESGAKVAADLIAHGKGCFDAIFAANDMMAIGCILHLQQHGWRVPDDLAVCGFDGLRIGQYLQPALTSVRIPIYELGQRALAHLLASIEGHNDPVSNEILPTELLIRSSCGMARVPQSNVSTKGGRP